MPPTGTNIPSQNAFEKFKPSMAFVVMIFGALIAFEIFNFSTTDHALGDLLGDLAFFGFPWSTILAVAFCGIDFAGIARLFTPETGMDEPKEVWYLFGAWLLAATMNAILTWWGVSMAVAEHAASNSTVVDPKTVTTIVPVFVAIMVWVIRILIIGTLSLNMDRLMHPGREQHTPFSTVLSGRQNANAGTTQQVSRPAAIPAGLSSSGYTPRPASRSVSAAPRGGSAARPPAMEEDDNMFESTTRARPEPTYHSMSGKPSVNNTSGSDRFRRS